MDKEQLDKLDDAIQTLSYVSGADSADDRNLDRARRILEELYDNG